MRLSRMCTVPKDLEVVSSSAISSASSSIVSNSLLPAAIFPPTNRRKRRRDGESFLIATTTTAAATTSATSTASTAMREKEGSSALIGSNPVATNTAASSSTAPTTINTTSNADNTLLRKILAGDDLASVRNHSVLVDSNFSLRRTSSMSTASSRYRSFPSDPNSDEKRRRRSTMFSQLTLPRRSSDHEEDDQERPCKRLKESGGGADDYRSSNNSPLVPIKMESRDPDEHPTYCNSSAAPVSSSPSDANNNMPLDITEKSMSKFPGKPSKRWRLKSPTRQSPSHSLSPPTVASTSRGEVNEIFPMRPRARTASELDNVIRVFTEGKYHLERLRLDSFDPLKGGRLCSGASAKGDLRRVEAGDKTSDVTSPLSQLLESTPPYSSGTSTIHPRANTTTSVFPWSTDASLKGISGANARLNLPFAGNGSKQHLHHHNFQQQQQQQHHRLPTELEMLNLTKTAVTAVTTESMAASILAATALNSSQFFQNIRDEQVLNFSAKEVSRQLAPPPPPPPLPPPISLSLTTDDILQWSPNQLAALQQLFRLSDAAGAVGQSMARPTIASVTDSQTAKMPIRLAHANRLLLCRRVAEWMLVANTWTMQMCPAPIMPENSLLATAATYRYCRCSEAELSSAHQIDMRLDMPRVGTGLRAVLHRIWPQLLLASMIRENFSFSTAPIPSAELSALIGRESCGGGGLSLAMDLPIAKAGTATSLKNLIKAGNQLFLDTQVFECVRKVIFAQRK